MTNRPIPGSPLLEVDESNNEIVNFGWEPPKVHYPLGPETFYLYENDDGTESIIRVGYKKLPPRWDKSLSRPIKLDRLPEPFETWDRVNDCWVKNTYDEADFEVGKEHKSKSHIIKSIEARLIKVGLIDSCFILVKEAEALGLDLNDLVEKVLEKESKFSDSEIKRRIKKEIK